MPAGLLLSDIAAARTSSVRSSSMSSADTHQLEVPAVGSRQLGREGQEEALQVCAGQLDALRRAGLSGAWRLPHALLEATAACRPQSMTQLSQAVLVGSSLAAATLAGDELGASLK